MSSSNRIITVNNIKLPIDASFEEAFSVASVFLKKLHIDIEDAEFSIYKKSVDARNKSDILFVYTVAVGGIKEKDVRRVSDNPRITLIDPCAEPYCEFGERIMAYPPLVVGAGPAGLFSALFLAEHGFSPILIERGERVAERTAKVKSFIETGILDTSSNIQFGAGGAGTFSDGKLITRINDPLSSYVMRRLVSFGAPKDIMYLARPHIGTDVLAPVVERIIDRIIELGGEIRYKTKYIDSVRRSGTSVAITDNGEIPYGALVLAIGHSARDTYRTLISNGYSLEAKQFSVGMRIEHLADDIDRAMYGDFAGHKALGHAEYNLSHNTKERGVYTFCMCPGGEVVAAASEDGGVVVNGMSNHSRSGKNSNSAVVCSIFKEDYGNTPEKAIEFQRSIERAAFIEAGGGYAAPIVTVGDFLNDSAVSSPTSVIPTYMGGKMNVKTVSPNAYLPKFVTSAIKNAIVDFDRKIRGFASESAILTGAETRTSSPVRILRDNFTFLAPGTDNIYPTGEGAGYAGGITSAAIDGLKTAISIIRTYKPL